MKKNILFSILLFICLSSFAQTYEEKFGKISMAEMEMKVCPIDSSAAAVMLFDIGETNFEYNITESRFQLKISRHARIKVLTKDGLDWANLNLLLYNEKNFEERLNSFKGVTYNYSNGKIQKDKVEKNAIFREKKDDTRTGVKIAFPRVMEGSIIEFDYEITSDYTYNLQPWSFQYSIPVLSSRYTIGIPEYYQYNTHISGYENVSVKNEVNNKSIVFITNERTGGTSSKDPVVRNQINKDEVKYIDNSRVFTAQNIPALGNESYVDNIDNYLSKVNFELAWVKFPGKIREDYTLSWDGINSKLLDDADFGKQLDNGSYLEDDLKVYLASTEKNEERLTKTISFIKSRIKWNDSYRLFTKKGVKAAYKAGVGSSSDVNLNLVVALRKAGFDAYPIVVSTRKHGAVMDWQVTVTGFNHVVAGVKNGDSYFYCDATSPFAMIGLLPTECLNGKARLIDLKNSCWVDLNPKSISQKSIYASLKINEGSAVTGSIDATYKDYFALNLAETVRGDDSLTLRKEGLSTLFSNAKIDSLKVQFGENGTSSAKEHYDIKLENSAPADLNIIYLSPMIGFGIGKNPFVKVERKFPVNFTFPRNETIIVKYKLPENFKVEEIPSNSSFSMPEGTAKFIISYQIAGDELIVVNKLTISNVQYVAENYSSLKVFFDEVIKKQNEKIILRRI